MIGTNIYVSNTAESFQQIQRAKEILTDPVKRRHYDSWRHSGIAMSYADWSALKDSVKTVSL